MVTEEWKQQENQHFVIECREQELFLPYSLWQQALYECQDSYTGNSVINWVDSAELEVAGIVLTPYGTEEDWQYVNDHDENDDVGVG